LALSIGLGALINALWLLIGLRRRGSYTPSPAWGRFLLQVIAGCALLAVFLIWGALNLPWIGLGGQAWKRMGLMALMLSGSALVYFGALWAAGVKLRQFASRSSPPPGA
jgi:putative peptidoglycan lipid II flippase